MSLLIPLLCLLSISTAIAYNLATGFARDAHDKELLNAAHAVAARLSEDKTGLVADLPKAVQAVLRHDDRDQFFYQVLNTQKVRVAGDTILPMPIGDTESDKPSFRYSEANNLPVRMARIRVPLHGNNSRIVIVQVARTMNARRALLNQIFLSIVVPQLVLGCLCTGAVWLGIRRGLKPLRQLSTDIQQRSQLDLSAIDDKIAPAEVVPIIIELNSLLSRLEEYIEAQHRFVANAAHQLRTPVAGLKAYIEYGRRVNTDKISEVLDQLDEGVNRIAKMVAEMLTLARTADKQARRDEFVDLNVLGSEVCSLLIGHATNKNIELTFSPSTDKVVVQGNNSELREMIVNLVENAILYTSKSGKVDVSIKSGPPITIAVADNGPGIPEPDRASVFERFYRVLGTKVEGSGLGLSIVREIAQAHNAKVELAEPPQGAGTLVKITF